jgi:chorismate mutase-like protein
MSLEALRDEIDRIDDQLHDLLMRRALVVGQVAGEKQGTGGAALRPGREARILRRLVERHKGALPAAVIVRIWRELVSAMVRLQEPMSVAVCAPERSVGYWDLARAHFGSATNMTLHRSPFTVLRAVMDAPGALGVLPPPADGEDDPWWPSLFSETPEIPRVIGKLPFLDPGQGRFEGLNALVIGRVPPEPSGDDIGLLVMAEDERMSRARLNEHIAAAGFDGRCVATRNQQDDESGCLHLIETHEIIERGDPRLARLADTIALSVDRLVPIGGYAVPIAG